MIVEAKKKRGGGNNEAGADAMGREKVAFLPRHSLGDMRGGNHSGSKESVELEEDHLGRHC